MVSIRGIPLSIDDIIKTLPPFPKTNAELVYAALRPLKARGHYSSSYSTEKLRSYGIAAFPSAKNGTMSDGWLVFIPK